MIWDKYNPNPVGRSVGDCAIRAVAKALDVTWETAYDDGLVQFDGGSEFAQAVDGRKQSEIWPIMDELMSTIKVMNERLYNGIMRKLH